ncbi:hypothetical protein ABKV19_005343, partial [Rosa sericea]
VNFTHITLIQKVQEPKNMIDLRPIALCNILYRICSKVLANRLKGLLGKVISPLQSAFVPRQLISDNTLVATEVAHFLHTERRKASEHFSLKLDFSKAYDRLEWSFLQNMLMKLGFAQAWVELIMTSIKTEECQQFRNILYTYEIASGQRVNWQKSEVAFSQGMDMNRQEFLASMLGTKRVEKHDRYLGLPTHVGRKKSAAFSYLKEKLTKKSWRLLQTPDSLIARLCKAIYFPTNEYENAELGNTPSFSWRSIWEACQ